jgi:hypothetical protein
MNKLGKIPKGKPVPFAAGGRTKMFGTSDRTKTKYPAEPQKPGRTGQHATKAAPKRGAKVRSGVVDEAGDMGGSRAANPRRLERLERIPDLRTRIGEAAP